METNGLIKNAILSSKVLTCIIGLLLLQLAGCKEDDNSPGVKNQIQFYNEPEEASIITTDIGLFWQVYDNANNDFKATDFKTNYFDAGTEALQLFFDAKVKNVSKLTDNLNNVGINNYYQAIRANTEDLTDVADEILAAFKILKSKYPEAVFSDIVFVIGALSTGGTVVRNGQMVIGTEMFSLEENTPTDGLNYWQTQVVRDRSFLPSIVIHELIHVQQAKVNLNGNGILNKSTLLDRAVSEGVADFLTEIIIGNFFNKFIHDIANPMEQALWEEFETEMDGTNYTNWLYNFSSATAERPGDLGYFIGYKMAEFYYEKEFDKTLAIKTLLELESGDQLLLLSQYDQKFD